MTKTLKISPQLALPIEAVTEKLAFLGRTGSGKTYAAQKLAEELHAVGAQFIALDPVGKWYSLRLAADGGPGIKIPVFGGLHGDVPLEATAGKMMADLIADRGISAVLDVSQFESDAAKNRFAKDFAERFFFRKKAAPSAVHLFLEEGQEFVPQNAMGDGDKQVLHAFTRIWKLGRNYGIGGSIITQRPQEVNKKVLNLTEILFAFQLTGPHERKAIAEWIKEKGLDIDVEALLPKLKNGHPHVWSPALLDISKEVAIGKKWTFDASSTPKVGAKAETQELAPIDLEKIRKDMAATIERAKAEDPRELRKQIAELRSALALRVTAEKAPAKVETKTIEKAVLKDGQLKRLEAEANRFKKLGEHIDGVANSIRIVADGIIAVVRQVNAPAPAAPRREIPTWPTNPYRRNAGTQPVVGNRSAPVNRTVGNSDESLPPGERKVLIAIAQHVDGVTREQLTILTGYKKSSRDTYLQRLSQRGFIEIGDDRIVETQEGRDALGSDFQPLPTGSALLEYWRGKLPEGERLVLEVAVAAHPDPTTRDAISEFTGYKKSSRDTYIQRLGARRLVATTRDGVLAADMLFD